MQRRDFESVGCIAQAKGPFRTESESSRRMVSPDAPSVPGPERFAVTADLPPTYSFGGTGVGLPLRFTECRQPVRSVGLRASGAVAPSARHSRLKTGSDGSPDRNSTRLNPSH